MFKKYSLARASTNSRGDKGLKPLVEVDHWGVQSSNFGFSGILFRFLFRLGLFREYQPIQSHWGLTQTNTNPSLDRVAQGGRLN